MQKLEETTPLFVTGGDRGPDAFLVTLSRLATSALRDATVALLRHRLDDITGRRLRGIDFEEFDEFFNAFAN